MVQGPDSCLLDLAGARFLAGLQGGASVFAAPPLAMSLGITSATFTRPM